MDREKPEDDYEESFPILEGTPPKGVTRLERRAITLSALALTLSLFLYFMPAGTRLALIESIFDQRILVGILLLFALVTVSLLWSAGQRFDAWLFLKINLHGFHTAWLDGIMWLLTNLGSFGFAMLLVAAMFLLHLRRVGVVLLLGMLTLWIMVEAVKALTDRRRPFTLLASVRVVGWKAMGLSFPSGHTSQAFFLATLISRHFQLGIGITALLYLLAILVAVTRVYVGAHYPRDVLAGALLGAVWGVLAVVVDAYLLQLNSPLP